MKRLKKFRTLENKINISAKIFCGLLIIGIVLVGKTYAEYKEETEVTFINVKVRWPRAAEISYVTTHNENVTTVEQALNDLYERLGS